MFVLQQRMAEMKKKSEEERQREMAFFVSNSIVFTERKAITFSVY